MALLQGRCASLRRCPAVRSSVPEPAHISAPTAPRPTPPPLQLIQDWRAFRARLVAKEAGQAARAAALALGTEERWAHVISQPERGCLLVARPRSGLGMFTNTGGCWQG